MKLLVIASVCAVVAFGQKKTVKPETATRILPADVLRDFPGSCFASTACRVFLVGETWPLTPFCGQSTCLLGPDNITLIERVQDCGLRPKPNPGCRIGNEADLEKPFPLCCPQYLCDEGVVLEYPSLEELQQGGGAARPTTAPANQTAASQATQGSSA